MYHRNHPWTQAKCIMCENAANGTQLYDPRAICCYSTASSAGDQHPVPYSFPDTLFRDEHVKMGIAQEL
jgi:hypothetical protein